MLKEYEEINAKFMDEEVLNSPDKMEALINRQAEVQDRIDALNAWELDTKLSIAMDALRCPPDDTKIGVLSGVSAAALRCAACCFSNRTCCCWMSRPTTWMRSRLTGWNSTLSNIRHRAVCDARPLLPR